MALAELALAALIVAFSAVGSSIPVAAWSRTREPRYLSIGGANLALLVLGLVWADGFVSASAPTFTATTEPAEALVVVAAALLLLGALLPRRR
jgi:hypothetical protein